MKRTIALLLVALLLTLSCPILALADSAITLREGRYIIGEDLEPGKYILTCTSTTGAQMGEAYGALGSALDAMEGTSSYGNLFGAFGGLMDEVSGLSVEILGDFGDVLASRELKKDEQIQITLKIGTALRISEGTCTLEPKK